MVKIPDILNDKEYHIISSSLLNDENLKRKSDLSIGDLHSCLVSHTLSWIKAKLTEKSDIYIVDILEQSAKLKESLSLSKNGKGLDIFMKIFGREIKLKDYKEKKMVDADG